MKTFGFIVSEIVIFIIIAGIALIITNDWFFLMFVELLLVQA